MNFIIIVLLAVVFLVLISGLVVMAIGGETNKKYSNKLMMARVGSQALVVFLLGLLFVFSR